MKTLKIREIEGVFGGCYCYCYDGNVLVDYVGEAQTLSECATTCKISGTKIKACTNQRVAKWETCIIS